MTAETLNDADVVGLDDNKMAEVDDIVLTPDGKVDALIVDFGGFLGIGKKRVAVGMDNLEFLTDEDGKVYVYMNATKEQLEAAADYDEATYATTRDVQRLVLK